MYYTLMYLNDCGDTVARDYFEDVYKAEAFMDELIKTYEKHGVDTGLRLEDSNGKCIREYYANDECEEDDDAYDGEDY